MSIFRKRHIAYLFLALIPTGAFAIWFLAFFEEPTFERLHLKKLPTSSFQSVDVSEGERIVRTICIRCHYNPETKTLAGMNHANPKRIGNFWSGNITQDSVYGIGKWTRADIAYLLRYGVNPNGQYVFDMPKYLGLSDEDLASVVSFLKSDDPLVRPTSLLNPEPHFSIPMKLLQRFYLKPPDWNPKVISPPEPSDPIAVGRYLAVAKFACFDCHSGNTMTNNYSIPEESWRFFEGGNPHANRLGEKVISPDLTASGRAMSKWSEDEFVQCVRSGIRPDGTPLQDPMFPFTALTDSEAAAIYQYLKTL